MGRTTRTTRVLTAALIITASVAASAFLLTPPDPHAASDSTPIVVRSLQNSPGPDMASSDRRPPKESSMSAGLERVDGREQKSVAPTTSGASVPNQFVLSFHPGTSEETKAQLRSRLDARLLDRLPLGNELVSVPGANVAEARAVAAAHPAVAYAEPNFVYRITTTPNDPRFKKLWGLENKAQSILGITGTTDADIDASEAWDVSKGSANIRVGVVDSGIAHDHPDLAPNIWVSPGESGGGKETNGLDDDGNGYVDDWRGWDWVDGDNDPADLHGHGTHVAGTIGAAGSDGAGITGVNWDVGLVPLRAVDANGLGTTATISSAFAYAGANGIEIVNASFGGGGMSQALADTIARYPDTLFVVAAGNDASNNDSTPMYPCNYPAENLICVASTTNRDRLSGFSNHGRTTVDLAAPGSFILSTVPEFANRFVETFETDLSGRWTTGGNGWGREQDGSRSFLADSPGRGFSDASDSSVATAQPLDLSGHRGCALRYDVRLDITAGRDSLRVEASTDGESWRRIATWSGTTFGRWVAMNNGMTPFDGATSVFLRFRLITTDGSQGAGADIDNVRVRCLSPTPSNDYEYYSGTSMAAPHVAGAAALVWAAMNAPSALVVKNALLTGTDKLPALGGKVATGGRLNVNGALTRLGLDEGTAAPSPVATDREPTPIGTSLSPSPTVTPDPSPIATHPDPVASQSPVTETPSATPSPPTP